MNGLWIAIAWLLPLVGLIVLVWWMARSSRGEGGAIPRPMPMEEPCDHEDQERTGLIHRLIDRVGAERQAQPQRFWGLVALVLCGLAVLLLLVIPQLGGIVMGPYLARCVSVLAWTLLIIAAIAAIVAAFRRGKEPRGLVFARAMDAFLGTDNRRWVTLFFVTLFVTGIAIANPGGPLITPHIASLQKSSQLKELRELEERHYNRGLKGEFKTNAEIGVSLESSQNPSQKTWVWWWVCATYWAVLLVYFFPAFWDDVMDGGRKVYERIRLSAGGETKLAGTWFEKFFAGRFKGKGTTPPRGGGGAGAPVAAEATGGGSIVGGMTPWGDLARSVIGSLLSESLLTGKNIFEFFGRR